MSRRSRADRHQADTTQMPLDLGDLFAPANPPATPAPSKHGIRVVNLTKLGYRKGAPLPDSIVDCSRYSPVRGPHGARLGNPFVMTEHGGDAGSRADAIRKHAERLVVYLRKPDFCGWLARTMAGKDLGCYCAPRACHAETYKAAAEAILEARDPIEAIAPFRQLGLVLDPESSVAPGPS